MSRQRRANDRQTNGQLVKGLRRRPLTAKTRVRFSYWLLETSEVIRKFFCLPDFMKVFLYIVAFFYSLNKKPTPFTLMEKQVPINIVKFFFFKKVPQRDCYISLPCGTLDPALQV